MANPDLELSGGGNLLSCQLFFPLRFFLTQNKGCPGSPPLGLLLLTSLLINSLTRLVLQGILWLGIFSTVWSWECATRLQTCRGPSAVQTMTPAFRNSQNWCDQTWKSNLRTCNNSIQSRYFYGERHVPILGFHQSVIKTKNRNHSMNSVKNLGYDRWLIYKQPRQKSGLCCFSLARYLQKCVTQIYRALYGDAMIVSFWGTQTWRP